MTLRCMVVNMKRTALNDVHKTLGAHMVEFAGYEMPLYYTSIKEEHMAVRKAVGIFDVSHMGDLWITGQDATDLVQIMQTNDFYSCNIGEMKYTHILNHEGIIKDDAIGGRFSEDRYLFVPNAATKDMIYSWLKAIAKDNDMNVNIIDDTEKLACIAVQGPLSTDLMAMVIDDSLREMKSFLFREYDHSEYGHIIVSTTGYTGEKGFEIILSNAHATALYKALLSKGKIYGIKPCGLGARDTLRMEKGFLLSGQDFNEDYEKHTPLETGYKWIVKFNHEFIGREAIEKQKFEGIKVKFVGMVMIDRGIPRHGHVIYNVDGEDIGHVTSGTMSPVLGKGMALGYIEREYAKEGTHIFIDIRGKRLRAEVKNLPLV